MTVLITGIRGFLGSALMRSFRESGHSVRGTSSRVPPRPAAPLLDVEIHRLSLGDEPHSELFAGIDHVIHCAHDFTPGARERNISGTKQLFEEARSSGVRHQVFISSYSAVASARTDYAKTKFELANFFLSHSAAVLTPGLVLGAGGLGGRVLQAAQRSWILPIPSAALKFPYIGLEDFCYSATEIISQSRTGEFNLWDPDFTSFPALVEVVREETGRPFVVLPIPQSAISLSFIVPKFFFKMLGRPTPAAADSWRSLKANQQVSLSDRPSHLSGRNTPVRAIVMNALREMRKFPPSHSFQ